MPHCGDHSKDHRHDPACFRCSSALSQPLVCEGCGLLQPVERDLDPFEIFSIERSAAIDQARLRRRLTALSRQMHPDFFSTASADERERSLRSTAELNAAFELLSDDLRRIDWLIQEGGGPGADQERQMPAPFLAEVLEWNETLEECSAGAPRVGERLSAVRNELAERLTAERSALIGLLSPLPPAQDQKYTLARRQLNAIRYLERARAEAEERLLTLSMTRENAG